MGWTFWVGFTNGCVRFGLARMVWRICLAGNFIGFEDTVECGNLTAGLGWCFDWILDSLLFKI